MDTTEMVSRVVAQARYSARAGSEVDEQAWFDAGEPDTVLDVPRQRVSHAGGLFGLPTWVFVIGALVTASVGYAIGFYLGHS